MKRGVIIFLIILLTECLFVRADIFGTLWGKNEGEVTIGGIIPGLGPEPGGGEEEEEEEGEEEIIIPTVEEGFTITPTLLVLQVVEGKASQGKIKITNIGKTNLTINLSIETIGKYVFPEEKTFILESGKTKEIILNVYVSEQEKINYSAGKVNVQAGSTIKSADIVLDIRKKTALFDIRTTLLKKILFQGQRAFANVSVLNFGELKNMDVELELSLVDENKNVYDIKKETFKIDDFYQGKFFVTIPQNLKEGKYFFRSKVSYKNVSAESYDSLEVVKFFINFASIVLYLVIAIILVIITLVSIVIKNRLRTGFDEEENA